MNPREKQVMQAFLFAISERVAQAHNTEIQIVFRGHKNIDHFMWEPAIFREEAEKVFKQILNYAKYEEELTKWQKAKGVRNED